MATVHSNVIYIKMFLHWKYCPTRSVYINLECQLSMYPLSTLILSLKVSTIEGYCPQKKCPYDQDDCGHFFCGQYFFSVVVIWESKSKIWILVSTLLRWNSKLGPKIAVHIGEVSTVHTSETYLIGLYRENKRAGQKVSTWVRCPQRRGVHRAGFYCTSCP